MSDRGYLQHLQRGGELLRADKVAEARVELERASSLRPGDAKILKLLGLACFRLEEYPQAQQIYSALVERHPEDASLRLNLGLVSLKLGAVDDALRELIKARDLDPSQTAVVGYLGLAYARKGEYAKAREAFVKAGQEDLAREMEQYLATPAKGVDAKGAASAAAAADAEEKPPVGVVSGEIQMPALRPRPPQVAPPPAAPPPAKAAPAPAAERTVPIAELPVAAESHHAPLSVRAFATRSTARPAGGELPFELAAGGEALIARVRGRLLCRDVGVVATAGQLERAPAMRRVRGRATTEIFGPDWAPMQLLSGHGHLVAVPRGGVFTALALDDEAIYLREEHVFGFEEQLHWESGHIPGSGGKVHVVQFRGQGALAFRTRRHPVGIPVAEGESLTIALGALTGWIGKVVPRVVGGGEGEGGGNGGGNVNGNGSKDARVECTGEGVILVEEPV